MTYWNEEKSLHDRNLQINWLTSKTNKIIGTL